MLLVILVALSFRYIWVQKYTPTPTTSKDLLAQVQFVDAPSKAPQYNTKKDSKQKGSPSRRPSKEEVFAAAPKFYFDPNIITADSLTMLGLPAYLSQRIVKYRSKGGHFRKASDLSKLYGIEDYYEGLAPWIQIAPTSQTFTTTAATNDTTAIVADTSAAPVKKYQYEEPDYRKVVDLNHADSSTLLFLTGVGPFYARTILEYREKLGGYYQAEQLTEAFATPDTIVETIGREWITMDTTAIRKIDINTADFRTLIRHPYINKPQVNAILTYRHVHGNYLSVQDIKKIHLISDQDYDRLRHYLTTSD